ncbi:galactokinase [uncultured Cohaesibacter sp.]|uniref:galactokinase n=1 Tax=uncultured Cohaesibacter sp. TaxID=1002546 RepID=UPI00292DCE3E|nr:galactokinase [uncultured Cohaesibacter sp.]
MSEVVETKAVADAFLKQFGIEPEVTAYSPGRVNLLGEHTDYNGGYVLPMALRDLGVSIALAKGDEPGVIKAYSDTFDEVETRSIEDVRQGRWTDYLLGCLKAVVYEEVEEFGLRVALATTLPMGAGLSSSAALEVVSLKGALELFGRKLNPVDVAILAQSIENNFIGMPCGIMDQFASSVGDPGVAMFLNTRSLDYELVATPEDYAFVIIASGVSHQHTENGYATRVAECLAACEALGVEKISDLGVADLDRVNQIAEPLNRRARHVIMDNQRVVEGVDALRKNDMVRFGQLMHDSHGSQRDDYEITVEKTDAMVEACLSRGALGARQTGGGWGGSVVALVEKSALEAFNKSILGDFDGIEILAVT